MYDVFSPLNWKNWNDFHFRKAPMFFCVFLFSRFEIGLEQSVMKPFQCIRKKKNTACVRTYVCVNNNRYTPDSEGWYVKEKPVVALYPSCSVPPISSWIFLFFFFLNQHYIYDDDAAAPDPDSFSLKDYTSTHR